MAVAIALPTLAATEEEVALVKHHLDRHSSYETANKLHEAYYEGTQRVQKLGISIPPILRGLEIAVGWAGTAVDVLEERLDWQGWTSDDGNVFGLDEIYNQNGLDVDAPLGILDSLIYGVSFAIVGAGYEGEPQPLVTIESPRRVTGDWDGRLRRLYSALSIDAIGNDGRPSRVTLYGPQQDVTFIYQTGRQWVVEDRNYHGLGRVPVVVLPNRPRASRQVGRSEITHAVRSYTDQAVRTLLGMEVHREFYQAPQRYLLGADESSFTDAEGNVKTGWETIMGRMLAVPVNEDGEVPSVGQFEAASPAPYLDQVRGLAQLLAGEAGIPATYLGFQTDNPASADAIRAAEARLIKRAERRQTVLSRGFKEIGALALLVRDGAIPDGFSNVASRWSDPATPTRSAAADEAVKLISAGVLTPDSEVTYARVGLTPQEMRQIASDKRRAYAQNRLTALAAAAEASAPALSLVTTEGNDGDGG